MTLRRNSNESNLRVDTKFGWIRGLKSEDGDYIMFMGMLYGVNKSNPFGVITAVNILEA